jgi:5'/3'-nucleotidase SurE
MIGKNNIRFATFNASLTRSNSEDLINDLSTPDNAQAKAIAEIIQRNNSDVILINEFDYDAEGEAIRLFQENYLEISQNGAKAVEYPYVYLAPSNTGIDSGFDFNNNGTLGEADDAFGFGFFSGQFGMVLLSKYPIVEENVRTFQNFLWQDMPGALLPDNPDTPEPNDWYSSEEVEVFRLSSKSHWDIPININGEVIHVLASHPTPPVFDGTEDRNGRRNHDEIRFWSDYITSGNGNYIYDDNGNFGGLDSEAKFVIMGDLNADPFDGDSTDDAVLQLLNNPQINISITPNSQGGPDATIRQDSNNLQHIGNPAYDTADFGEIEFGGPGNLRADYVLPSYNLEIINAEVFWPESDEPNFDLVGDFPFPSSDHRLVFTDVNVADESRNKVTDVELLGEVQSFKTGFLLAETEVGGLSSIAYNSASNNYYALSDDRSENARFYTLNIDLSDGSLDEGDVSFESVTTLSQQNGDPFVANTLDPEGIAISGLGTLYISSEGNANELINPFINQFSLTGEEIDGLNIPAKFLPTADNSSGIRNNLAFESLTITPDKRFLYTATENTLYQDGSGTSLDNEGTVRIVKYDLTTKEVVGEFVYIVEAIPTEPIPADGFADNGLVELLAIDNNGTLLALERSFAVGVGNTIRLYEINTQGALDVSSQPDLFWEEEGITFEIDPAVNKRLLVDLQADLGISPDNVEGMTLGPILPDGSQSLILVSDNNFSDAQTTQFIALGLDLESTPVVLPELETPYTVDDGSVINPESLNILLVNDDGYQAEGINIMYDALVAAGHNVTLVAPKEQQSGKGTLINVSSLGQPTEVVEFEPDKWYVDGSPVTTTLAALDFILDEEAPDLVISGINEGANIGANIAISSGTVSAATTATRQGIPAIAVSANIGDSNEPYELGAEFVVELIDELNLHFPGQILPDGVGLNVNIPEAVDEIEGVAYTRLDETGNFDIFVNPETGVLSAGGPRSLSDDPQSEGVNFINNYITVTPLDGDWTASDNIRQTLEDELTNVPEIAVNEPLDILLTNDDGFGAEGIEILYDALVTAGHNVTLVAPSEQQSGTGTVLDVDKFFQPLDIVNVEGDKWSVDGGVRTTTWAGLDFVLEGEAPDLVISGINAGENIGPGGAVSSGTVSAAVTALLRGVPAIAISGGLDLATFDTPTETYEIGADYLVSLLTDLQAIQVTEGNESILPEGIGLNINIPARFPEGIEEIQGVAFTNASDTEPFDLGFGYLDDTETDAGLTFGINPIPDEINPTSEGDRFLSGFITVTPIDGNWTAPEIQAEAIDRTLATPEPVLAGDSDDPAIWVNPENPEQSLIITTLKDGGLVTFDLDGNLVQQILPADFGDIRYNNVDLIYNFEAAGFTPTGTFEVDLAVVSDRENDSLAIYSINRETQQLEKFATPELDDPAFSIFGVDDGDLTAYGLATYTSPVDGKSYVFVTQAGSNQIAQLELTSSAPADQPLISAEVVRILELPVATGDDVEDYQSEAMVVDRELGILYVAVEGELGIVKVSAEVNGGDDFSVVQPIGADYFEPDLEGLTIYYGENGKGYLIASSQGDSSYAVFSRENTNEYLGSFAIGDNGDIDQVNETDGLDVINIPLGDKYPFGLMVVQDGANDPQFVAENDEELENRSTNFKFVPWENVANSFDVPLDIDTTSFDPRNPQPQTIVNGVASGDTTQNSTVLWARSLAPGEISVFYAIKDDLGLPTLVTAEVTDINQPVKIELTGLNPDTEYTYTVTDAAGDTASGSFHTSGEVGTKNGLKFGATGDWRGEVAPYPAIANVVEQNLEFFFEHGDTIYADIPSPAVLNPDGTRKQQVETLEEYRAKHSEVYGQRLGVNVWADIRSSTSILATIDDHEVTNDFAGGDRAANDDRFGETEGLINDTQLYENGLQAFQEYNPLRDEFYEETGDEVTEGERKLYRYNTYGSDAAVMVLDARSFRDGAVTPPSDISNPDEIARVITESFAEDRTLLGEVQLNDLKNDLLSAEESGITWKFIMIPEPIQNLFPGINTDAYEGYNAERTELLKFIDDNGIENVVFIAADVHTTFVNNLTYQETPFGEQIATNVWEITTGSVAFDEPTGEFVGELFTAGNPEANAFYNSLPIAPDRDDIVNDKDDFVKQAFNDQLLTPLGYDPLGLNNNLPQAEGLIDATLIQGDYFVGHSYGWTQFEVNPFNQQLRVTTYGIEAYSEAELLANPDEVLSRQPVIVSEFVVNAEINTINSVRFFTDENTELQLSAQKFSDRFFDANGDSLAKIKIISLPENGTLELNNSEINVNQEITFANIDRLTFTPNEDFNGQTSFLWNGSDGSQYAVQPKQAILNVVNVIEGNDRDNTLNGSDRNDLIFGRQGNDTINGNEGDDFLSGGKGDDLLNGNAGNDIINGNAGNDTIDGGTGIDLLVGSVKGNGNLTLTDTELVGNGTDSFTNIEKFVLRGGEGDNLLSASEFTLAQVVIRGKEGNDTLIGGANNDKLYGNRGTDTFVLRLNGGRDIIADFEDGIDKLALSEGINFEDLTIGSNKAGTSTSIGFEGQNLAVLRGIDSDLITENDFQ